MRKRRIYHFAREFNLDPETALQALSEAGFSVNTVNNQIARSAVEQARRVLKEYVHGFSPTYQPFVRPNYESSVGAQYQTASPSSIQCRKNREIMRLTPDDVLVIRRRMGQTLIAERDAFGRIEPLWQDKFEMAVNRQYTSGAGIYKYNSIPEVGAALAYGLTLNHAFENGNKRTALVSLLIFLQKNKHLLIAAIEDDLYELMASIARHDIPISEGTVRNADSEMVGLASWIKEHTRGLELGDRSMEFKEFSDILTEQGCTFDSPKGNYIKIHLGGRSVKTGYPRPSFTVPVQEVKKIRRALCLDEWHGFDSLGFYNLDGAVDGFVNQYRNLLRRLADL